ncbi:MAG TPA: hypothetical protein DIW81_21965 [Planctomycetaceae bacterium]|nr:hypothetical protein [Rubinisphaera sp.]HCS54217.1 hypothetical protein [Planctomycetaceae bacterium]
MYSNLQAGFGFENQENQCLMEGFWLSVVEIQDSTRRSATKKPFLKGNPRITQFTHSFALWVSIFDDYQGNQPWKVDVLFGFEDDSSLPHRGNASFAPAAQAAMSLNFIERALFISRMTGVILLTFND